MTTIAPRICVCADDWAAESAIKASNAVFRIPRGKIRSKTMRPVQILDNFGRQFYYV